MENSNKLKLRNIKRQIKWLQQEEEIRTYMESEQPTSGKLGTYINVVETYLDHVSEDEMSTERELENGTQLMLELYTLKMKVFRIERKRFDEMLVE